MRFNFSAEFLRVLPPDTTFGEAWESLCHKLLATESPSVVFQRIRAPDKGIDIYARRERHAYQCKANERGAGATGDATAAAASLRAAILGRTNLHWVLYRIASNADFTAPGIGRIHETLAEHGLPPAVVEFLGPDYWENLCLKHQTAIDDRFYYRVTLDELHVIEALKQARYYDHFISEAQRKIRDAPVTLRLTCNRLHLEFRIPFSRELTARNLLDVCKELYGINLDWIKFTDLSTSAGTSVSIASGDTLVPFERKIGELVTGDETHLEFWIKIIWEDGLRKDAVSDDKVVLYLYLSRYTPLPRADWKILSYAERRDFTLRRFEEYIQNLMWERTFARKITKA